MKFRLLLFIIIPFLALVLSCAGEPKDKPILIEDVLPGYWELIAATRNGKPVPSLQGAYFEFDTLNTISTNFTGKQVVSDYQLSEQSILYKEGKNESKLDFIIKDMDTLQFNTEMRKIFKFELTLLRTDKNQ